MTSTRPNQHEWVTAFQNQPPSACATLRALSNTIEYGVTCVFGEEDGDPTPNPINTACLPWATGSVPTPSAFYSPATACPTSWSAVSTRTTASGASDWIDGETALECCPPGFVGGGGGICNPGSSGAMPVVRCGEADAEENENVVYTAGQWPAGVTAQVTALQLRYQPSDVGSSASATATGSGSLSTNTSTSGPSGSSSGKQGLSTGAKAAIGTTIPLAFILFALAAFLLWRRRKHRKAAAVVPKDLNDGHDTKQSYEQVPRNTFTDSKGVSVSVPGKTTHETPEWNAELDATEAERRRYMAVQGSLFPSTSGTQAVAPSPAGVGQVNELGGMMRVGRKPVPPIELDSTPVTTGLHGSAGTEGSRI
ncbi:hypothetical protein E8E13_011629 [Curvularia kusanoi]|uniref:Uncharacterized protein n=1 Tax=Curvularia kusanoi TaxID=90978 RepID=A0A9P4TQA9_CURKU|nr:hypothetical protein E8E13_011629 [Curvularia kusanoi]